MHFASKLSTYSCSLRINSLVAYRMCQMYTFVRSLAHPSPNHPTIHPSIHPFQSQINASMERVANYSNNCCHFTHRNPICCLTRARSRLFFFYFDDIFVLPIASVWCHFGAVVCDYNKRCHRLAAAQTHLLMMIISMLDLNAQQRKKKKKKNIFIS